MSDDCGDGNREVWVGGRIGVWGVCDTGGISITLRNLLPDAEVTALLQPNDPAEHAAWFASFRDTQDVLVVAASRALPAEVIGMEEAGFRIIRYPVTYFRAFHPDLFYVGRRSDKKLIEPAYNSGICVWCYVNDVSRERAASLFNHDTYAALGYYDQWEPNVATLQAEYDKYGLDFRAFYLKVKRTGAFMHSINHPKAETLTALGKVIARKLGAPESVMDAPIRIPDGLAHLDWPVYPEIGRFYGVRSTYRWTVPRNDLPPLGLQDFIARSYKRYQELGLVRSDIFYDLASRADAVLPSLLEG